MICQECRTVFEADDGEAVFDRFPYGEEEAWCQTGCVCPQCGSECIEEETTCAVCEQEFARHELEDGLCGICAEETDQSLRWMWNTLSPAQRTWASEHTQWMDA